jgi:hypothetical protein
MADTSFRYKQKIWLGPVTMIFFGFIANFFLKRAQNSTEGLTINNMIELSPDGAAYFHWAAFGFSALLVVLGMLVSILSLRRTSYVVLGADSIKAPKSALNSTIVEIPFSSITALKLQNVQKQIFLHIEHTGGKLVLVQSLLPSKADFDEICQYLAARKGR